MAVEFEENSMSDEEFNKFRKLIYEQVGINLLAHKKIMLQGRIRKRLNKLGMSSFKEYYALVQEDRSELVEMFNVVSTNKTEFFRENHHFEFLKEIMPSIIEKNKRENLNKFSIWSSASSTGEEPYTIAMTLMDFPVLKSWDIKIIASDISTTVLTKAHAGLYHDEAMRHVPKEMIKKYFIPTEDDIYRVSDSLKDMVKFKRINLISENYPFKGEFEIIFCRNVMIYFDRQTQINIINNFLRYLKKGGYLILGSSESLPVEIAKENRLKRIKSTIYQKII